MCRLMMQSLIEHGSKEPRNEFLMRFGLLEKHWEVLCDDRRAAKVVEELKKKMK
jgi:hypothetical protein